MRTKRHAFVNRIAKRSNTRFAVRDARRRTGYRYSALSYADVKMPSSRFKPQDRHRTNLSLGPVWFNYDNSDLIHAIATTDFFDRRHDPPSFV
jgi:hypothetical protein